MCEHMLVYFRDFLRHMFLNYDFPNKLKPRPVEQAFLKISTCYSTAPVYCCQIAMIMISIGCCRCFHPEHNAPQ